MSLRRVEFKDDVEYEVDGVLKIMLVAQKIWQDHGKTLVITAGTDGNHMEGSKHYTGDALDLRTHYFSSQAEVDDIAWELQVELGPNYDVLVEPTHIHAEYDPDG